MVLQVFNFIPSSSFFRYRDDQERFRVHLVIPIMMCLVYLYLIIVPIIDKPSWNFLFAILFGLGGLIFYVPFVLYSDHLDALKELQCFCSYCSALLRQIKICDD